MTPPSPPRPTAGRFATIAGCGYTVVGVLGLAMTGLSESLAGPVHLGVFQINPLQNLVHVAVGVLLLGSIAVSDEAPRTLTLLTAAAMGVLGLTGLALVDSDSNVLAVNGWSNALHITTALWASAVAVLDRTSEPAGR